MVIVIWSYDQVALVRIILGHRYMIIWPGWSKPWWVLGTCSAEPEPCCCPHMVPGHIISLHIWFQVTWIVIIPDICVFSPTYGSRLHNFTSVFRGFAMFLVLTFNSKISNCSIVHCSEVSSEVYLKNIHLFNCSVHIFLEYSFNIYFICSIVQRFAFKKILSCSIVQRFNSKKNT